MKLIFQHNILSNWLADSSNIDKLVALQKMEHATKIAPNALRALFVLYMPDKALAENIAMRLRFARKHKDLFIKLANLDVSCDSFKNPAETLKLIYKYGKEFCINKLLINAANTNKDTKHIVKTISNIDSCIVPIFPITGKDIAVKGISDNKKIGATLNDLEQKWIDSEFIMTRMELLDKID